jgi:protein gp37
MANTSIEWTEKVWNPVRGCSLVSAGCTNCYAMKQAHRFSSNPEQPYWGLTKMTSHGPVWNGNISMVPSALGLPLSWGKPARIFVNSMSDLFHDDVPFDFIAAVFAIMGHTTRHTYQVLTKRPQRMLDFFNWALEDEDAFSAGDRIMNFWPESVPWVAQQRENGPGYDNCGPLWPHENVWLGVSVENQEAADERIPLLLQAPAALRWLSCEPLLGPIDLFRVPSEAQLTGGINWVVVGGESGPGARPMHPFWAQSLRDQSKNLGIPFFFKQWGAWRNDVLVGKRAAGRLLDGVEHSEYPA